MIGIVIFMLFNSGCRKDESNVESLGYGAYTTLKKTIIPNTISPFPPLIYPYEIAKYSQYGYGGWHYGDGIGSYSHSFFDQGRFQWLISDLDKCQAEGKLAIIATHIPMGIGLGLWHPASKVTEQLLIDPLHACPNHVMWISGHRHLNSITPQPSKDPNLNQTK